MMRRHGCQLPVHAFQMAAITVFLLLAVAFYVFFAPFLGSHTVEFAAMGLYSPVALAVFLLYIRCTIIDPSDSAIFGGSMTPSDSISQKGYSSAIKSPCAFSTSARSSSVAPSDGELEEGKQKTTMNSKSHVGISLLGAVSCRCFIQEDNCKSDRKHQLPVGEEDERLYCTLCNAEVGQSSKHCRNCDKCVEGFDHHCRWLNNCVGRKNYVSFILLMATSLLLLVMDWGVGIAVFVRYFVAKGEMHSHIVEKLGKDFPSVLFAVIVAICTVVALIASLPLAELFVFHLILIKKGITTYEYVVAMRAYNEGQTAVDGEHPSMPSSPISSSVTGMSGASSLGIQYRGGWCTPPRVFVEHQDEVVPHPQSGRISYMVDSNAGNLTVKLENRLQRQEIKRSAWKLAKLNPDDAIRAAAKARERSSVLRPLKNNDGSIRETDCTSMSSRSSFSAGFAHVPADFVQKDREVAHYLPSRPIYHCGRVDDKSDASKSVYNSPSRGSLYEYSFTSSLPSRTGSQLQNNTHPMVSQSEALHNHAFADSYATATSSRVSGGSVEHDRVSWANHNVKERRSTEVFWNGRDSSINVRPDVGLRTGGLGGDSIQASGESSATHFPCNAIATDDTTRNGEMPPSGNLLYNGVSIFFGGPLLIPSTAKRGTPS